MEKKGFGKTYIDFWKRSIDYKGTSDRREFWLPVGLHIALTAAAIVLWLICRDNDDLNWLSIPFWILLVFLFVTLIPFVAVTVRRLRDTGLSGLWAFLLLFVGAGTFVVLALCAGSSGFYPGNNRPVNVYGPPPWYDVTTVPEPLYGTPAWDETDPAEKTPAFDPSRNEPVDVYGPPEWFGTKDTEDPAVETPDFDPANNEPVAVYGPPEWFENSKEGSAEDTAPFDPSRNTDAPLYGPPEWFTQSDK